MRRSLGPSSPPTISGVSIPPQSPKRTYERPLGMPIDIHPILAPPPPPPPSPLFSPPARAVLSPRSAASPLGCAWSHDPGVSLARAVDDALQEEFAVEVEGGALTSPAGVAIPPPDALASPNIIASDTARSFPAPPPPRRSHGSPAAQYEACLLGGDLESVLSLPSPPPPLHATSVSEEAPHAALPLPRYLHLPVAPSSRDPQPASGKRVLAVSRRPEDPGACETGAHAHQVPDPRSVPHSIIQTARPLAPNAHTLHATTAFPRSSGRSRARPQSAAQPSRTSLIASSSPAAARWQDDTHAHRPVRVVLSRRRDTDEQPTKAPPSRRPFWKSSGGIGTLWQSSSVKGCPGRSDPSAHELRVSIASCVEGTPPPRKGANSPPLGHRRRASGLRASCSALPSRSRPLTASQAPVSASISCAAGMHPTRQAPRELDSVLKARSLHPTRPPPSTAPPVEQQLSSADKRKPIASGGTRAVANGLHPRVLFSARRAVQQHQPRAAVSSVVRPQSAPAVKMRQRREQLRTSAAFGNPLGALLRGEVTHKASPPSPPHTTTAASYDAPATLLLPAAQLRPARSPPPRVHPRRRQPQARPAESPADGEETGLVVEGGGVMSSPRSAEGGPPRRHAPHFLLDAPLKATPTASDPSRLRTMLQRQLRSRLAAFPATVARSPPSPPQALVSPPPRPHTAWGKGSPFSEGTGLPSGSGKGRAPDPVIPTLSLGRLPLPSAPASAAPVSPSLASPPPSFSPGGTARASSGATCPVAQMSAFLASLETESSTAFSPPSRRARVSEPQALYEQKTRNIPLLSPHSRSHATLRGYSCFISNAQASNAQRARDTHTHTHTHTHTPQEKKPRSAPLASARHRRKKGHTGKRRPSTSRGARTR